MLKKHLILLTLTLLPLIASANEPALRSAYCAPFFNIDSLTLEPLKGGCSTAPIYAFFQDNKKYVLRYTHASQRMSFQDELTAHKAGAALGIAPEIICADPDAQYMVMPFVDGHLLSSEDIKSDDFIRLLGNTIRKLHNFSGTYPTQASTLMERISGNFKEGQKKDLAFPSSFGAQIERLLLQKPKALVPSHTDLHPGNIIVKDHTISLIDWALATFDDPFTDLCYISLTNNFSLKQEQVFLETYLEKAPTEAEWQQLSIAKSKYYLFMASIYFLCAEVPKKEQEALIDQKLAWTPIKSADEHSEKEPFVNFRTASKEEILQCGLSFYKKYLLISSP